jgi:hypothetical protein
VAARRRHLELSVERPVGARASAGTVARLTATFEAGPEGNGPSPADLAGALDALLHDRDELLGPAGAEGATAREERDLRELVETYRPRQRELVDLLLADGEITPREHGLLLASLSERAPAVAPPAPAGPPADLTRVGETPIAAVPLSAEPKLPPARAVPELLRTFQITSLRQAGAVRARRQISFAEYMALKRHFESEGSTELRGTGARTDAG